MKWQVLCVDCTEWWMMSRNHLRFLFFDRVLFESAISQKNVTSTSTHWADKHVNMYEDVVDLQHFFGFVKWITLRWRRDYIIDSNGCRWDLVSSLTFLSIVKLWNDLHLRRQYVWYHMSAISIQHIRVKLCSCHDETRDVIIAGVDRGARVVLLRVRSSEREYRSLSALEVFVKVEDTVLFVPSMITSSYSKKNMSTSDPVRLTTTVCTITRLDRSTYE